MIAAILRLRPVDILLVCLFTLYAILIVVGLIYVEWARIRDGKNRTMNKLILHIKRLIKWIRSDREEECPDWADPEKWRQGHG